MFTIIFNALSANKSIYYLERHLSINQANSIKQSYAGCVQFFNYKPAHKSSKHLSRNLNFTSIIT